MFSNDYKAVKTRLGYCFDLLTAKDQNKEALAEKDSIILGKRMGALRNLIAGQAIPKHEILLNSTSSLHSFLKDQVREFENETDEIEKGKKLLRIKNFLDVQTTSANLDRTRILDLRYERDQIASKLTENASLITGLVNHTIENSKIKGMFDAEKAKALNDEFNLAKATYDKQYSDAWKALTDGYNVSRQPFIDCRNELLDKLQNEDLSLEQREALKEQYKPKMDALQARADAEYKRLKSVLYDDLEANYKAQKERIQAEKIAMAKSVKDAVFAQSTVSYEDAEKWITDKVTITKAVTSKMKKNGITPEKFNQDLKDFFVITNGRLGKIKIDTKNHQRAYASGTTTHESEGFVMLDNDFSQRVLWHELAHHLESDDNLRRVAQEYIKSRSLDGGKQHKIRDLTGSKAYGHGEIAYKTDMYSHYAAKIYAHGSTEVFSMGVEALYNEETLFSTMLMDPKTIEFVTGALMQSKPEMDLINQKLRDGILDTNADIENTRIDMYQEVFQQLAGVVKFSESVSMTMDDLIPGDRETLQEWGAKSYGTLTLPNGKELILLKSSKVKYISYRGRTMKGVYALDFKGYEGVKIRTEHLPRAQHFNYGFGDVTFGIQSQDLDKVKVLALSMDLHRNPGYSIRDSKGEIGEGFLSFEKLDNLKKQYLQG